MGVGVTTWESHKKVGDGGQEPEAVGSSPVFLYEGGWYYGLGREGVGAGKSEYKISFKKK